MKRKRRLLLVLLVPVLLIGAGALAFRIFLPAERIAAIASEHAEAALGREVGIERVKVSFFPRPAVALDRVSVAGKEPKDPPFATVRRIALQPRVLPLLKKRIVVDAVTVERPSLLVESDAERVSELPVTEAAADVADEQAEATIAFLVRRLAVRDGRIAYRDRESGTVLRVEDWEQDLRIAGRVQDGEIAFIELDGHLDIGSLAADAPEHLATPIEGLSLAIEHEAVLDVEADSITVDHLSVRLQELDLEGAGTIHAASDPDAREVSLRLGAAAFRVEELIRSLPAALVERADALPDVRGEASLRIVADGPLQADTAPEIDGTLTLQRFDLGYHDIPSALTGVGGVVAFSLDSVSTTGIRGRFLDEPFSFAFSVHDLADPKARATLRASLDLARLYQLGLMPDSLETGGDVSIDLAARGSPLEPEALDVEGSVQIDGITLEAPTLLERVVVESGELVFLGQEVRADRFRVSAGDSDLALEARVHDWIAPVLDDTTRIARAEFDARSTLLDLDALLGVPDSALYSSLFFARLANREPGGRSVAEIAEEAGLGLPPLPPIEFEGRLRAWEFRRNGLELSELDVELHGNNERVELSDASFQFLGGGIQIAGQLELPTRALSATDKDTGEAPRRYPTALTYQIEDVGAAPFFDRLTPFKDHLSGSLLMAGSARMILDEHLLPERESVAAEGSIAISDGRLANWPVLQALGEQLGTAIAFDTLEFQDWIGEFDITGPTVALDESILEAGELRALTAGVFDFAGDLDLTAALGLSTELVDRVQSSIASRLVDVSADDDGRVPVGLRITGPATGPELALDFSDVTTNVTDRVREAADERARRLVDDAVGGLIQKVQPKDSLDDEESKTTEKTDTTQSEVNSSLDAAVDSLTERTGSARSRVEDKVRDRLCQIRKCD